MKYRITGLGLLIMVMAFTGCVEKVTNEKDVVSFRVTFSDGTNPVTLDCGETQESECEFSLEVGSFSVPIKIEALDEQHSVIANYSRSVLLSVSPAGIISKDDPLVRTLPDGRRVMVIPLNQGEWSGEVSFRGAFGAVSLFVEDVGYEPAADSLNAACHDLYPSGGCYASDDDNPLPGTGSVGVSDYIYFDNPRVYDLQVPADEDAVASGARDSDPSQLSGFRIQVDGDSYDGVSECQPGESRLVVTQVSVSGFFVTDVCNRADNPEGNVTTDYASMYVYNFNTPEELYRGDCLRMFQGAIDEFQGYTEIKNPFWTVDTCNADDETCDVDVPKCSDFIPEPTVIDDLILDDPLAMEKLESSLVTVENSVFDVTFTRCDKNGDGVIDYDLDSEKDCKYDCGDVVSCVVKEDYDIYFTWKVSINGSAIGVVTNGVVPFDPEDENNKGLTIHKITGTLKHLDFGAPPWIIIPRDPSDFCLTEGECE